MPGPFNSNHKHLIVGLVNFLPFVGVAPRRYFDFFQLHQKRKDDDGNTIDWRSEKKEPRVKRFVLSYIMLEIQVIGSLPDTEDIKERLNEH